MPTPADETSKAAEAVAPPEQNAAVPTQPLNDRPKTAEVGASLDQKTESNRPPPRYWLPPERHNKVVVIAALLGVGIAIWAGIPSWLPIVQQWTASKDAVETKSFVLPSLTNTPSEPLTTPNQPPIALGATPPTTVEAAVSKKTVSPTSANTLSLVIKSDVSLDPKWISGLRSALVAGFSAKNITALDNAPGFRKLEVIISKETGPILTSSGITSSARANYNLKEDGSSLDITGTIPCDHNETYDPGYDRDYYYRLNFVCISDGVVTSVAMLFNH